MKCELPPIEDIERLHKELTFVPLRDREDAVQEAWLAHLEGRDVVQAIKTYVVREHRHRKRVKNHGTIHDVAIPERETVAKIMMSQ